MTSRFAGRAVLRGPRSGRDGQVAAGGGVDPGSAPPPAACPGKQWGASLVRGSEGEVAVPEACGEGPSQPRRQLSTLKSAPIPTGFTAASPVAITVAVGSYITSVRLVELFARSRLRLKDLLKNIMK